MGFGRTAPRWARKTAKWPWRCWLKKASPFRPPIWAASAEEGFTSTPAPGKCCCTGWRLGATEKRGGTGSGEKVIHERTNSRPHRRRFRRGPPNPDRSVVVGPGDSGNRDRERSLRGRRAHATGSAGRDSDGHRNAPHGWPDVPAEDHEPAPDSGDHLFFARRTGCAKRVQSHGIRRSGYYRQTPPR